MEGLDYIDNFSLVVKTVTVRVLLVVSATSSWPIFQLYVNNVFLHVYLDEEIYMVPSEGLPNIPFGHVCHLLYSLYGLKWASQ